MRNRRPSGPIDYWPSWRYSPTGEGKVFQRAADVPFNWTRKPGEPSAPLPAPITYDRADILSQLAAKGIKTHPAHGTAHLKRILDGDIHPGEVV